MDRNSRRRVVEGDNTLTEDRGGLLFGFSIAFSLVAMPG